MMTGGPKGPHIEDTTSEGPLMQVKEKTQDEFLLEDPLHPLDLSWMFPKVYGEIKKLECILKKAQGDSPHKKKYSAHIDKLIMIQEAFDTIEEHVIPKIEAAFHYQFQSSDLLKVLFLPSRLDIFFKKMRNLVTKGLNRQSDIDFRLLLKLSYLRTFLPLVGDCVLDVTVAHLALKGQLRRFYHKRKPRNQRGLVSNVNLARICDHLNLYDYRIRENGKTQPTGRGRVLRAKGNLVEGIYAIIYFEKGMGAVCRSFKIVAQSMPNFTELVDHRILSL